MGLQLQRSPLRINKLILIHCPHQAQTLQDSPNHPIIEFNYCLAAPYLEETIFSPIHHSRKSPAVDLLVHYKIM